MGGVASLELERRGRLGNLLHDERALETHAVVLDAHPGLLKEVTRPLVQEVDPDLLQDRHRVLVDGVDLVFGQQVVRLEAVLPHDDPNLDPSPGVVT